MKKKVISTLMSLVLVLSMTTAAFAADTTNVHSGREWRPVPIVRENGSYARRRAELYSHHPGNGRAGRTVRFGDDLRE